MLKSYLFLQDPTTLQSKQGGRTSMMSERNVKAFNRRNWVIGLSACSGGQIPLGNSLPNNGS
jgi:hypothetical protein